MVRRFAECFTDRRDPRYVEHRLETLLGQRIFGLALGYEDLNDHDELRKDPTFTALAGKLTRALRSDCEALAGKSTLNRLEHTPKRHGAQPLEEAARLRQRIPGQLDVDYAAAVGARERESFGPGRRAASNR